MASGKWSETDRPIRPGFYNRFKAVALARIQMGKRGIVAMPVKANWGPVKEVVRITSEKDLINNFGDDMDYSAYRLGRLALLGQPKELLLYRMADGTEKPGTLTLKAPIETAETDAIKLDTIYPSSRAFKISVAPNIIDDTTTNITLYEGTKPLYEFKGLSGTPNEIATAINEDEGNKWLKATSLITDHSTPITLTSIAAKGMTGGNAGVSSITSEHYIGAMSTFEGRKFNGFTLDGVTDQAIHTTVRGWVERNRDNGKKIRAYLGGASEETIADANIRSKDIDYEGVLNIGATGGILDGVEYSPAEVAAYICALGEGQDMKDCLCNQATIFEDVTKHLTNEEIESALSAGTTVLRYDSGDVIVEDDVNTLQMTEQKESAIWEGEQEQKEVFRYLRAVRFIDMVDEDTSFIGNKQYVGKCTNERTGQLAIVTALKLYFETLQTAGFIEDFTVEIDEELQKTAANDEFFWIWDAKYINVMKKIFGTGYIR